MSTLRRFWFTFINPPPGFARGCGVTAYYYEDAMLLLRERVFDGEDPEIEAVVEDVSVSTLDPKHVLANMEAPNWRGVWYPMGLAERHDR